MKKNNLNHLFTCVSILLFTFLLSCDKTEPIPNPTAAFDGVISGKTLKFTNTSTNGETYTWDFGDGSTSTEKEPTHTYKSNGSYVVKLTVTNTSGTISSNKVFDVVNIKVDGVMDDWKDVPMIAEYKDKEAGTIKAIKMENLGKDKLFVYLKTANTSYQFYDFFIDSDNNSATGFASWMFPLSKGIDILMEGYLGTKEPAEDFFLGTYDNVASPTNKTAWTWKQLTPTSNFLKTAKIVKGATDSEIEFVIDLTEFPAGVKVNDALKFFIIDVIPPLGTPKDWTWSGVAPAKYGEANSAALTYKLNL